MIKIENVDVFGWKAAIRGMRNPMNSWKNSDSIIDETGLYEIGKNDLERMKSLVSAGSDDAKFMRMINVTLDITAPLYWWKEFDTYKVGTVRNSCSTMHKIHTKEFTLDDFSHEHLFNDENTEWGDIVSTRVLEHVIFRLNHFREKYLEYKSFEGSATAKLMSKDYWYQMIQLLPSSYNQRATVQLNYGVLLNIYRSRKNHKLDEWREFCKWIESLPYSELITME